MCHSWWLCYQASEKTAGLTEGFLRGYKVGSALTKKHTESQEMVQKIKVCAPNLMT